MKPPAIIFLFIILISLVGLVHGQDYCLQNEEVIFSFKTKKGKFMFLNRDRENKYIIYRFGSKKKIEFEFPGTTDSSWKKFKYSFYLRGGWTKNEGLDLNYVYFIQANLKYVIYELYYAGEKAPRIGIKIIDAKTNKSTIIKGNPKTRKGNLLDFRDNNLLDFDKELFD